MFSVYSRKRITSGDYILFGRVDPLSTDGTEEVE